MLPTNYSFCLFLNVTNSLVLVFLYSPLPWHALLTACVFHVNLVLFAYLWHLKEPDWWGALCNMKCYSAGNSPLILTLNLIFWLHD